MKLRGKLLLVYVVAATILVVVMGAFLYTAFWDEQIALVERSLSQQIAGLDYALDSFLEHMAENVSTLAALEVVRNREDGAFTSFLEADEDTFTYDYSPAELDIIEIFAAFRAEHPYVSSVYMGRENGSFVRSHPRNVPTRYDPRERPWYQAAAAQPDRVVRTDFYSSVTTSDINTGFVRALVDDQGFYGVVGIDVTIEDLGEYIRSYALRPAGTVLLLDRNGLVVAAQDRALQGRQVEDVSLELAALLGEPGGEARILRVGGQRQYLLHRAAADGALEMVALVPFPAVRAEIIGSLVRVLGIMVAGLLLLSLATLGGTNLAVTQPIRRLTAGTEQIARTGDLSLRLDVASRDEVGELAGAFNRMVETLGETQRSLVSADAELRDALERQRDIIAFLPDATFVLDEAGRVVAWNRACEELTGAPAAEVIGVGSETYTPLFGDVDRPLLVDLLDRPAEELARYPDVRRAGDELAAERRLALPRAAAQGYYWITAAPLYDRTGRRSGAIEAIHDITPLHQMQDALQQSEREYRELVEHSNSIIMRWGANGRITFMNSYGRRFFGYREEEIVGAPLIGTIVPVADSAGTDLARMLAEIRADPQAYEQNVNENKRRSGERVWIQWTNRIHQAEDGAVTEILSVGTDITARIRAEEAVRELNAGLERRVAERTAELALAVDRAESADRLKSSFLATMSHELRTPLNSIIGFTGILLQKLAGPLNEEQNKQLGMVQSSARHLLALINDVLDISKIEAGELQVASEPFRLDESIERVVGIIRPLAESKGLALVAEPVPQIGPIAGDARRVEQVLMNLLNNAIKFTPQGTVTLRSEIRPAADGAGPFIELAVADTGIGIKPEDLAELFVPFRQVDTGLARQHEGTGLGLAICRRLLSLMGGEIWATSVPGEGSTFYFTLPLKGEVEP